MVAGDPAHAGPATIPERSFPPISELAVASMALVVIGGIYIASYVPRSVPLVPALCALAGAGLVLLANLVTLSRLRDFAWNRFFQVFRWALLAYAIIAGMIGYAFIVDGTRGSLLLVLVAMLLIFAVDIPLLLAFSVARYQETGEIG